MYFAKTTCLYCIPGLSSLNVPLSVPLASHFMTHPLIAHPSYTHTCLPLSTTLNTDLIDQLVRWQAHHGKTLAEKCRWYRREIDVQLCSWRSLTAKYYVMK